MKVSYKQNQFMMFLLFVATAWLTSSCVTDATGSAKATGDSLGISGGQNVTTCTAYFDASRSEQTGGKCFPARCEDGTHEGTEDEVNKFLEDLEKENIDDNTKSFYRDNIASAKVVCLAGAGILRPDKEVFINSKNLCACQQGKSHTLKNCDEFCRTKNDSDLTLYGEVSLSTNVELNYGSLQGWCSIAVTDNVSPNCRLFMTTESGGTTGSLPIEFTGNRTFKTNITTVAKYDVPQIVYLQETQSKVSSDSVTLPLKEPSDDDGPLEHLARVPVNRYKCISRASKLESNSVLKYEAYAEQHYFFIERNKPVAMLPNRPLIKCHDRFDVAGRENDNISYKRLSETTGHMMLWDNMDVRLRDQDGISGIDLNATITKEYRDITGDDSVTIERFFPFTWLLRPEDADHTGVATTSALGMIMGPTVIKNENNRGECPTSEHYESSNVEYNILGKYIGVDTEGLYMAESEPFVYTYEENGVTKSSYKIDILLVKESDLKAVDFYFENEVPKEPNENSIGSKTIHFYYPFDKSHPLTKKDYQRIYTVKFPDEIGTSPDHQNSNVSVDDGIVTGTRPSDKRFACIPKT